MTKSLHTEVIHVQVRTATGQVTQIEADGAKLLVGAGAHCDLRITEPRVAQEHALLEVRDGAVVLFVHQRAEPALVRGMPTRQLSLGETGVAVLGSVELTVTLRKVAKSAKAAKSGATWAFAVAFLVLCAGGTFGARAYAARPVERALEPVALFDAVPTGCHGYTGDEARAYGESEQRHAEALRERYPFAVEEGPRAVRLLDAAVACFAVAGAKALEGKAAAEAKSFRAAVEQDYRVHHLRLVHALEVSDEPQARREIDALQRLSKGRSSAYTEWLRSVDRRLVDVKAAKKKK
jgi:hypothetical protein